MAFHSKAEGDDGGGRQGKVCVNNSYGATSMDEDCYSKSLEEYRESDSDGGVSDTPGVWLCSKLNYAVAFLLKLSTKTSRQYSLLSQCIYHESFMHSLYSSQIADDDCFPWKYLYVSATVELIIGFRFFVEVTISLINLGQFERSQILVFLMCVCVSAATDCASSAEWDCSGFTTQTVQREGKKRKASGR